MGIMVRRTTNRDSVVYVKIRLKPNYFCSLFKKISGLKYKLAYYGTAI